MAFRHVSPTKKRKGENTCSCIHMMEQKIAAHVIFLKTMKMFDTVPNSILIAEMRFTDPVVFKFQTHAENGMFCTNVNKVYVIDFTGSLHQELNGGPPKISLIFVNDLLHKITPAALIYVKNAKIQKSVRSGM